ncbi:MAG: hypothetical protein JEZ11_19285 [Desulfobacterales bacterium]|nr:hypothetical protein [Desulfobacterales bacterium]
MFQKSVLLCSLIIAAVALQGCVMSSTPFQAQQALSDEALVYLYRPESLISRGIHFSAILNDKESIGPLINNAYIPIHAKPGALKVVLQKNSFPKSTLDTTVYDNLESGKIYYLKANPGLFGAYTLVKMETAVGKAEVSSTSYYQSK